MTWPLKNDKYNFDEWTIEDREDALDKVFAEVGEDAAEKIFTDTAEWYHYKNLDCYDWDDVDDVDDAFFHNAWCSPRQALLDLAALTYANDDDMSWEGAVEDVFRQIS